MVGDFYLHSFLVLCKFWNIWMCWLFKILHIKNKDTKWGIFSFKSLLSVFCYHLGPLHPVPNLQSPPCCPCPSALCPSCSLPPPSNSRTAVSLLSESGSEESQWNPNIAFCMNRTDRILKVWSAGWLLTVKSMYASSGDRSKVYRKKRFVCYEKTGISH